MSEPESINPIVFNNCISVKVAAFYSGYNVQYLRRLLRDGRLSGLKLGQAWLIDKFRFEAYLENANHTKDKLFGPRQFFCLGKFTFVNTQIERRERHECHGY
jgi:excisionase family DNA binding protein